MDGDKPQGWNSTASAAVSLAPVVFLLEHSLWQAAEISALSGSLSWCSGAVPDCGCWWESEAVSQTHFEGFWYSRSCLFLYDYPPKLPACHWPFRSVWWSRLPAVFLLYLVVYLDTGQIGIVDTSGLKASEGSKALQQGAETCLEDICLLAAQARA